MKATSNLLASLLFVTACGNIVESTPTTDDDLDDNGLGTVVGIDLGMGDEGTGNGSGSGSNMPLPPPPELPFLTEAPRASTSARSLFSVSFANGEVRNVVGSTSTDARYDILEQRIVTKTDEATSVSIRVVPPTGVYARRIATDVTQYSPGYVGPTVQCADHLYNYGLPECETTPRPKSVVSASGAITRGRWKLSLVHEASNTTVAGCVSDGLFAITCALPAGVGVAYKVVLAADGFSELWNDVPGLTETVLDGVRFSGVIQDFEFQCVPALYEVEGNNEYCHGHWVFNRYTAIDQAALSFDPMTIAIAAAGATKQFSSAALTWDAGNDDLPGDAY